MFRESARITASFEPGVLGVLPRALTRSRGRGLGQDDRIRELLERDVLL